MQKKTIILKKNWKIVMHVHLISNWKVASNCERPVSKVICSRPKWLDFDIEYLYGFLRYSSTYGMKKYPQVLDNLFMYSLSIFRSLCLFPTDFWKNWFGFKFFFQKSEKSTKKWLNEKNIFFSVFFSDFLFFHFFFFILVTFYCFFYLQKF